MSSFFDEASLVMIPSGYKDQKVYSVKPLDGAGDLTFTRASNATRVASNGLIEKVRTNITLQSQNFTTTWNQNASPTITANTTVAPDGTTTADTIAATASFSGVFQSFGSVNNATEYSWSVYIKNISSASNIFLGVVSNPSTATINFDATTGTIIGTGGSITGSSVTNVGNGWYRLSGTYISTGTTTNFAIYGIGVMSFAAWGAQLETGVTTDYIATTTTAVSVGPVSGLPRLDYPTLGQSGSCPRLLLEPQRTNQALFSEQFTNAVWINQTSNTTITKVASSTAPDGYSFTRLVTTGSSSQGRLVQLLYGSETSLTYTLYVRGTGSVSLNLFMSGGGNFNTGVITLTSSWQRLSISGTRASGTGGDFEVGVYGGSNLEIYGAQLEAGAYATSYIPTLGTSVTRVADAASKTGISSLIGQTEGTIYWEGQISSTSGFPQLCDLNADGNKFIQIYNALVSGAPRIGLYIQNVSLLLNAVNIATISFDTNFKFALAYKNNDYAAYLNGNLVYTNTTIGVPPTSNFGIGSAGQGAESSGKKVAQAILFKTRLPNESLAELTSL